MPYRHIYPASTEELELKVQFVTCDELCAELDCLGALSCNVANVERSQNTSKHVA